MKNVAIFASLIASASAFAPSNNVAFRTSLRAETEETAPVEAAPAEPEPVVEISKVASSGVAMAELESIATKANPIIQFWDPLGLSKADFWGEGEDATIGFLRQAEIKHSRVAMAAFVGFCVQSNFVFPWKQSLSGAFAPSTELSPEAQWDAIPYEAKLQIILFVGFLEWWDETGGLDSVPHYMRGRKPGQFPSFKNFEVHPVLDLYDPFGRNKGASSETNEKGLIAEINNGRLAMLGIFSLLAADSIPGSVPAADMLGITQPYTGSIMIPFEGDFTLFPEITA